VVVDLDDAAMFGESRIMSSVMLRGALQMARQEECELKTGALLVSSTS